MKLRTFLIFALAFVMLWLKCKCCPWAATTRCACNVYYELALENRNDSTVSIRFSDGFSEYTDSVRITPRQLVLQPGECDTVSLHYEWVDVDVCYLAKHTNPKYRRGVSVRVTARDSVGNELITYYPVFPWDTTKLSGLKFGAGECTCYSDPGYCERDYWDIMIIQ